MKPAEPGRAARGYLCALPRKRRRAGCWLAGALVFGMLTACGSNPAEKSRSEALKQYETIIRWSQWDAAVDFLAPEYLEANPISRLDMDRLRLFRVTQYTLRSARVFDDGLAAQQVVEIRLFNTNQAVERTLIDQQEWRYDPVRQRWLLHSGLPDPTQGR